MLTIWIFPKWYPNRNDPQFGVFIRKHAKAIAIRNKVFVLYIQSENDLQMPFEIIETTDGNLNETIIFFRKANGALATWKNGWRYYRAFRTGVKILLRKSKPDLLLAYIMLRTALAARMLSRKLRVPYIVSEQWSGYVTGRFPKASALRKVLFRKLIKDASALTCVSSFLLEGMRKAKLSNPHSFIIPNCIEINSSLRLHKRDERIYVLIVADLVDPIKNISGVIRMTASVNASKNFEIHIIGKGPDEHQLKKLVADLRLENKIFFEGLKPNEEVYEYLHTCDFLVMNSRFETFSLICAEAMSCGKPVIATRCGGPDEFIDATCGILITPDDPGELKDAFLKMLDTYNEYDNQLIRAKASQLFSPVIASERFADVFKSVLQNVK